MTMYDDMLPSELDCWYCDESLAPENAISIVVNKMTGSFLVDAHEACVQRVVSKE